MLEKCQDVLVGKGVGIVFGMAFSLATIKAAWTRSGAICECTTVGHGHEGRCTTRLLWTLQGAERGAGWRACRKTTWGPDSLVNCEISCAADHDQPSRFRTGQHPQFLTSPKVTDCNDLFCAFLPYLFLVSIDEFPEFTIGH